MVCTIPVVPRSGTRRVRPDESNGKRSGLRSGGRKDQSRPPATAQAADDPISRCLGICVLGFRDWVARTTGEAPREDRKRKTTSGRAVSRRPFRQGL